MKKIAVIIKHPFRDSDWRIDIYEVPEDTTNKDLHDHVMSKMLGPFEIMGMTERVSEGNKMQPREAEQIPGTDKIKIL